MPNLNIKNVPESLIGRLKQSAAEHRRSLNSEIVVCLERAMQSHRANPEEYLGRVRRLREKLDVPPLSDKMLRRAKDRGRP